MNARDIEIAVARFLGWRRLIIVPNVSWGLGLGHEADLLVMWASGFCEEYEIKISLTDLRAERKKKHGHRSVYIRALWFAVPAFLTEDLSEFPERAGVVSVDAHGRCRVVRPARKDRQAQRLPEKMRWKLLHLGCMRIWSLKEALIHSDARRRPKEARG